MGKFKLRINAQALLYEYMCLKVKNNLGNFVDEEEFKEFAEQLLFSINNSDRRFEVYLSTDDFKSICEDIGKDEKVYTFNELVCKDGVVKATYDLKSKSVLNNMTAREFMKAYFEREVASRKYKPDYFGHSYPDSEYELTAKNIAAYLVHYLMNQYIELNIGRHKWPEQCWCPYYSILDKDLAKMIHLPGTRGEFISIYVYAQKVIGEMLKYRDYFEISNNPQACLAFSNFSEIVAPFESMDFSIYNQKDYAKKHRTISIIYDQGEVTLCECKYEPEIDSLVCDEVYKLPETEPGFIEDVTNSGKVGLHLAGTHKHFVS